MDAAALKQLIKSYPDFPGNGVIFRDISPILGDPAAFKAAVDLIADQAAQLDFDKIVVIDARGFLFGSALAYQLTKGLVLCRKKSKLPGEVVTVTYHYEYSQGALSIQRSALSAGEKVLLIDDVLATGHTVLAAHQIVDQLGARVAAVICLVELAYLNGRQFLQQNLLDTPLKTVIRLES